MYSSYDQLIDALDLEEIKYSKIDQKIAVGILLYSVILADGRIREEETNRFREILENDLSITEDELFTFEDTIAKQVSSETIRGKVLETIEKLPLEEKTEILSKMNDIALSDREFHEFELNLVTKTLKQINAKDDRFISNSNIVN